MARRKLEERNVRKLIKGTNGSYSITLPIEAIRLLDWQKSQKLVVEVDKRRGRIVIKDWTRSSSKKK
jgi:bifunctional DNA-binding transcriptional regulator/antitoxin component of YhaV-PrlF toxin-antitoxin module